MLRAALLLVLAALSACTPGPPSPPDPVVVRTTAAAPSSAGPCALVRVPVGVLAPHPGEGVRLLVVEVAVP